jgi:hypothetical protein
VVLVVVLRRTKGNKEGRKDGVKEERRWRERGLRGILYIHLYVTGI